MRIIEALNNIYQENNNGNTTDKSYQIEEEFKSGTFMSFKLTIEELHGN